MPTFGSEDHARAVAKVAIRSYRGRAQRCVAATVATAVAAIAGVVFRAPMVTAFALVFVGVGVILCLQERANHRYARATPFRAVHAAHVGMVIGHKGRRYHVLRFDDDATPYLVYAGPDAAPVGELLAGGPDRRRVVWTITGPVVAFHARGKDAERFAA